MNITVRGYKEEDLCDMITIWNEVVEEGNAFRPTVRLRSMKMTGFSGFIFFTRTMSVGAVTYLTQVLR